MRDRRRPLTVATLGTTQTLAWASSYYLPAIIALPIARDLGVSVPTVFASFSVALVVSALVGPLAGRAIDRWGGRPMLLSSNLVFASGLSLLSIADSTASLFIAWMILGVGMGTGLYEAAFSALVRLYGTGARGSITGITLVAGFASTIGWPLSALLEAQLGWRGTCVSWAMLHIVLGIPFNALLPRALKTVESDSEAADIDTAGTTHTAHPRRAALSLAFVFAVTWFISTAMAAHLPLLLQAGGASVAVAVAAGALIGPAQVGARLLEFGLLRRFHPLLSARLASLMHPIGAVTFIAAGAPTAALFAVLHGAGNGILTIANATLPLTLFGSGGYGARLGWLMIPARVAQASAPWVFGVLLYRWGVGALWVSTALAMASFLVLVVLFRTDRANDQS